MAKFMQLSNEKVKDREAEISKYWKEIDLLNESVKQPTSAPVFKHKYPSRLRPRI